MSSSSSFKLKGAYWSEPVCPGCRSGWEGVFEAPAEGAGCAGRRTAWLPGFKSKDGDRLGAASGCVWLVLLLKTEGKLSPTLLAAAIDSAASRVPVPRVDGAWRGRPPGKEPQESDACSGTLPLSAGLAGRGLDGALGVAGVLHV